MTMDRILLTLMRKRRDPVYIRELGRLSETPDKIFTVRPRQATGPTLFPVDLGLKLG